MKILSEIQNLVISTPNDSDLGAKVRALHNKTENNSNGFIICIKCGVWQSVFNHNCIYCGHEIQNR